MRIFTRLRLIVRKLRRSMFRTKRDIATEKYNDIMLELRSLKSSSTLSDLLKVQKLINEFKASVTIISRPYWVNPMIRTMENVWNLKYKLWKERG